MSLAFEPSAVFWDSAFTLADRIERADAARAELAPLRVHINLLAGTAGVRPEVDLWPHLTGVTACLLGDSERPGRPTGAFWSCIWMPTPRPCGSRPMLCLEWERC